MGRKKDDIESNMQFEIYNTFQLLLDALDDLTLSITGDKQRPAWSAQTHHLTTEALVEINQQSENRMDYENQLELAERLTDKEHRQVISSIYENVWMKKGQDSKTTIKLPGVICVSPETIRLARLVNKRKNAFKTIMVTMKKISSKKTQTMIVSLYNKYERNPVYKDTLEKAGYQKIHLVQTYRQIPILDQKPDLIGFSWLTKEWRVESITRQQAIELAAEKRPASRRFIDALDDERFAIARELPPKLIANIRVDQHRYSMKIGTPLMYADSADLELPQINKVGMTADVNDRQQRIDKKISEVPVCRYLQLYCYLK